jgi:hypothetical protein
MTEREFMSYGMLFFMGYVQRREKSHPDYVPNSLIRAFLVATAAVKEVEVGRNASGVALDGPKDSKDHITAGYMIVLKRLQNGVELVEIRDLVHNVSIPFLFALVIFSLQIKLDKFNSDRISVHDAVAALNECFESPQFVALGDRWPIARDNFFKAIRSGKIPLPKEIVEEIRKLLIGIDDTTPWEKYPSKLRTFVAPFLEADTASRDARIYMATTHDHTINKSQIFTFSNTVVLGGPFEFRLN